VTEAGVRGLVIGAAGWPCHPDPHREALDAELSARAVLCDPDPEVTLVNRALLAPGPRVSACEASVRDPAVLLALAEVAALPRPLFVLLPLVAHFWPPALAAEVLREWGALLPARSVTAMSLWIPDGTRAGDEFAEWFAECGARMFGHSPADVAGWLEGGRDGGRCAGGEGRAGMDRSGAVGGPLRAAHAREGDRGGRAAAVSGQQLTGDVPRSGLSAACCARLVFTQLARLHHSRWRFGPVRAFGRQPQRDPPGLTEGRDRHRDKGRVLP
jgi:hypothetical protein